MWGTKKTNKTVVVTTQLYGLKQRYDNFFDIVFKPRQPKGDGYHPLKGIVSDSNNIILWHESEDINKKSLFPKFQLLPILRFQVMHDYVWFIAPIDYCVE